MKRFRFRFITFIHKLRKKKYKRIIHVKETDYALEASLVIVNGTQGHFKRNVVGIYSLKNNV